jgi:hypothetical protein
MPEQPEVFTPEADAEALAALGDEVRDVARSRFRKRDSHVSSSSTKAAQASCFFL